MLRFRNKSFVLTKPLNPNGSTHTKFGDVDHKSIIGKHALDVVTTSNRWELRLRLPTLDEYVRMIPRVVTPV